MRIFFVLLLIVLSNGPAHAEESFTCRGDLKVYGYDGKTTSLLSAGHKSFIFTRKQLLALAFTADQPVPIIKVYPWNGIHWVDVSKRIPGSTEIKPKVATDGKNWFSVELRNTKHIPMKTTCEFQAY